MIVNEISLWGAALVAILVVIAMIALAFVDRKMLRRMLVIFGATVAQMIVVGAVVLLAFKTFAWWAYLLWYLLILFLSICWVLYPVHFMWKRALIPVSAAMLAGSIVVGGCTILCLPMNVYLTDGLSDGIDDPDHGELPAQPARLTHESRGAQAGTLMA